MAKKYWYEAGLKYDLETKQMFSRDGKESYTFEPIPKNVGPGYRPTNFATRETAELMLEKAKRFIPDDMEINIVESPDASSTTPMLVIDINNGDVQFNAGSMASSYLRLPDWYYERQLVYAIRKYVDKLEEKE